MLICISREFGSGGHEIGKRLAKVLGYSFYDRELVTEAVQRSNIPHEVLTNVDEKRENPWLHSVVYDTVDQNLRGISANEAMFRIQSAVILEMAQQGSCVFVGRCADDVLKKAGIDQIISIFITASFSDRVQRKMELLGEEEKAATVLVRRMDKQRKSYYNYYTGKDWGKPYNYDLCINSSPLGIEKTAEALAALIEKMEKA